MKRTSDLRITRFKTSPRQTRNCRNLLVPSRVRRQAMAENLNEMWLELRGRATIETDIQNLWHLTTDLEKSKKLLDAGPQRNYKRP